MPANLRPPGEICKPLAYGVRAPLVKVLGAAAVVGKQRIEVKDSNLVLTVKE